VPLCLASGAPVLTSVTCKVYAEQGLVLLTLGEPLHPHSPLSCLVFAADGEWALKKNNPEYWDFPEVLPTLTSQQSGDSRHGDIRPAWTSPKCGSLRV
jgi:hypothetical protein